MITTSKAGNRILSLALALSLVLGMTLYLPGPVTAEAAGPYDDTFDFTSVGDITFNMSHDGKNYLIYTNGTAQSGKRIAVDPGITVSLTLQDVDTEVSTSDGHCAFSIGTGAVVYLTLEGNNSFRSGRDRAGLEVPDGATLVITGDSTGSLDALGGVGGAGIGGGKDGDSGAIVIEGGDVRAVGGTQAAGIGGGSQGSSTSVTIRGGTVEAESGSIGAGIGGGWGGNGGSVVIEDGDVRATGRDSGAGIGGGQNGSNESVRISGGQVTAIGGYKFGAGIGGGGLSGSAGGEVVITGGYVTAEGGSDLAAGIGAGGGAGPAGPGGVVRIAGGVVNATTVGPGRSEGSENWNGAGGTLVVDGGSLYLGDWEKSDMPQNGQGETLYQVALQVGDPPVGHADVTGGAISTAPNYDLRNVRTDSSGVVSFWLPAGETNVRLTVGGLTYGETFQMLPHNVNTAVLTTSGVTGVAVDPVTAQLKRGEQQQFTATVSVVGGADRTVRWSVDSADSSIDATGLLTVGADEAADTLTVRATSTFDQYIWGEAVVTVVEDGAPVRPSASPTRLELHLQDNPTGTVALRLGMSGDGVTPLATGATAVSADPAVAAAPEGVLSGDVTITAHEVGKTHITFTFNDPGNTAVRVNVTVADSGGSPDPGPTSHPSATIHSGSLRVGDTTTLRVSLGQSGGAPVAAGANILVEDETVVTVEPVALSGDGDVTVTAVGAGETDLRVTFDGAGSYDTSVRVTVSDQPGPTPGGSSGSRSSSSGGSSIPDGQRTKTAIPASSFSWDGRTLTIDHERLTPLGLQAVRWNGQPLEWGTDFGVYSGSVIIRFSEDFIAAQAPGSHAVRVEFLNHTGEASVTVGETLSSGGPGELRDDKDTHNPNTGGDPDGGRNPTDNPNTGGGQGYRSALLLGSVGAASLVFAGRDIDLK